ncbi:hypothetical protein ACJIZ3_010218 [Penstemon smallii]|uniref:Uncharacterized protein n=1 Tax=Penstemon smallii TaxID=265156 RepID=A0ABD3TFC7_9LAMI
MVELIAFVTENIRDCILTANSSGVLMDRPPHDYGAGMPYVQQQQAPNMQQQQQQYGFHPQHQQFPPSVHGPPFLPPHPSHQQFPYPRPMQQPQLYPHPPPHPHLHQQSPPSFSPHVPPHLVPSHFHNPYDSAPPPAPPPSDPELQKRIDKLVEYAVKNGPEFESVVREREQDNPAYSFLFGGEGHNYYRYKLWISTRPMGGPFNPPFPSSMPVMHPTNPMMSQSPINAPNIGGGAPHLQQPSFPPFYEQQHPHHSQPFVGHSRPEFDQHHRSFKGLSRPLPSDVEMELNGVLNSLTGTKESIKGAKTWFMQRSPFVPALAESFRDRVLSLDDSERQLHILYLANDILFDSLQRRVNPQELDNEALAFKPVLGSMLARIYHNPHNKEENQSRLQKILQFWASKEVYDQDTIRVLENEMLSGLPPNSFPGPHRDISTITGDPSAAPGLHHGANQSSLQWLPDKHSSFSNIPNQENPNNQVPFIPSFPTQQFHPTSVPSGGFSGPIPMPSSIQQPIQQTALTPAKIGENLPPYPLFPPGLIPGMVRKMQIGSGVPYSPMSPLDIPTVIPPSNVSPTEVLERVSKFFKEIGEVNPSEGPMKSHESRVDDDYEFDREVSVRTGGSAIPPPGSLNRRTFDDGSVERKPGSSSSGRLGLGATADPNEPSQYDDVYSSYRKHRSTNYHTSMSRRFFQLRITWTSFSLKKRKNLNICGVVFSQGHSGKNLLIVTLMYCRAKKRALRLTLHLISMLPQAVSSTKDYGAELIGCRVKVWRPKTKTYCEGTVASYNPSTKKHLDQKTRAQAHASSNVSLGDDMDSRGHVIKKHKGDSFDLATPKGSSKMSKDEETHKPEVGISPIGSKLSAIPGEDDLVNINGYKVKATTAPVLEAIFAKYGDITAHCLYKSLSVKASLLEVICNIVQRLQYSHIEAILSNLEVIENEISDVEASKIEVAWLHDHLEKVRKVAACGKKCLQLREDKVTSGIVTKSATKELTQRRAELMEALERFRDAEKRETVMKLVSRKIEDDVMYFEGEELFLKRRLNDIL